MIFMGLMDPKNNFYGIDRSNGTHNMIYMQVRTLNDYLNNVDIIHGLSLNLLKDP